MCKLACRFTVYAYTFNSHTLKQTRHDDSADRVDSIKGNLESGLPDCLHIYCRKLKHRIDMSIGEILFLNNSKRINIRKVKVLSLGTRQNSRSFFRVKELSPLVKELKSIPLLRIVRGCKDDTSVCLFKHDSHFSGRSGSEAGLHDIHTAGDKSSAHKLLHHITGKTRILADYHLIPRVTGLRTTFPHLFTISVCELYNIKRRKALARSATYGSADSGNGFDQCHILKFLTSCKIRIL